MRMSKSDHFDIRKQGDAPHIRAPKPSDGPNVWRLIDAAGALDANSLYCNLLQCSHFAATCALAELDGEVIGWMSGHMPPDQPDTLFVWQVCVTDAARGLGLGQRLINSVLERPVCEQVRNVECTITKQNAASWALFHKVARTLNADLKSQPHFLRDTHLGGLHESEFRVTIGPFEANSPRSAKAA
ncbi:MAG: L-2,4-diaminobutyric acid acetyltransferase [Paracoccaceae bacterium]|jgi:L-2,4-diaminobutyric acid acetyltransferase